MNCREVEILTPPSPVNMGDAWFDVANLEHFWIRRRMEVALKRHRPTLSAGSIAEIGCGHGLVQRAIEDGLKKTVTGFDLNLLALEKSFARTSPVCCYDIHERDEKHQKRYDVIICFDVLEHIADEKPFLESVLFHLADDGVVIVNVPAFEFLKSAYDDAAGHQRRYTNKRLADVFESCGCALESYTYWGLPLIPALIARRLLQGRTLSKEEGVIEKGFKPPGAFVNSLLMAASRMEILPNRLAGTSLMASFRRARSHEK